jgi:hypothetical protein
MRGVTEIFRRHVEAIRQQANDESITEFLVCTVCKQLLSRDKLTKLSKTNGFSSPPKPQGLLPSDAFSERFLYQDCRSYTFAVYAMMAAVKSLAN